MQEPARKAAKTAKGKSKNLDLYLATALNFQTDCLLVRCENLAPGLSGTEQSEAWFRVELLK